ncbi:MAG: FtsX-like permease family protein [Gemmatimonadota bacterium]
MTGLLLVLSAGSFIAPLASGEGVWTQDTHLIPCRTATSILVERSLAADIGLSPGDSVDVGSDPAGPGCRVMVAGVYEPDADPSELARERPRILMHLPEVAAMAGRDDEVDRFSIRLRDPAGADAVAHDLVALMPGTRVLRADVVAARASTTFEVVRRFHRAIGIITITAGGVFLACIMTLKVQERRSQVAALRLVGVSRKTLLSWLILEAALVSVFGGILGIGIGSLASRLINGFYQRAYQTTLEFSIVTTDTVWIGLVLAVSLGLIAGAVGAVRLLQVDALAEVGR